MTLLELDNSHALARASRSRSASLRVHGGPAEAELRALGLDPKDILDFSSSINPYGPHPLILKALRSASIERYPDSTALAAREALARLDATTPDHIVLGNGAAELLWTLARCWLCRGDRALIAEPTFSEFRAAALACGSSVSEQRAPVETGFRLDLGAIFDAAERERAGVVYLCSPNTPTGSAAASSDIAACAELHPEIRVVLDQSFSSSSECFEDAAVEMPDNVVRVRSLTKDHAIPGVRVGYLIASPEVAARVEANRPAWTTSAFAQAAAIACADASGFVAESRERLLEDRRALAHDLAALGVEVLPSRATFLLARVPDARWLRSVLLTRHAILIRDCESFGLPGFIRLAAKPPAARARLIAALEAERGAARDVATEPSC
jgi:histidinol-phosphate aminotransferase